LESKLLEKKLEAYQNRTEVFEDNSQNFDYSLQEILLDK